MPLLTITTEDPRADDVRRLLARHHALMLEHSPPEGVHALDVDGLCDPSVTFVGGRADGELLAVGALKRLGAAGSGGWGGPGGHAELKSMHVAAGSRGLGLGRHVLDHLLALARSEGLARVSLETGSMAAFLPARTLYACVGFRECGPFDDYQPSPFSTFMTLDLEVGAG
ncbi:GNAT family N-acetyltransferase [Nocardioides sp. GCM10027113]|uniref:GNAT family N-acetyltransferase n=1 Tax=unclassified Nocardioides TaxID=2615069 RepID=UPI003623573B